jgi:oxaloacetate decarboxylase alpha subunit
MATIQLVDVSIRDGNQSIWGATGLNTPQCLQIAPIINRVGFRAIDFIASTHMAVAVKYYREDPWERIRLMRQLMPDTPLQFISVGFRFISWETLNQEVMRLVYRCLVRNGISRFVVLEPMHDLEAMLATARMIREEGGEEIIAALTFTLSDAHDDTFYANLTAALAKSPDFDRAYIKDPSGLLGADRARTLIPAVQAAAPSGWRRTPTRSPPVSASVSCMSALARLAAARLSPPRFRPSPTCASSDTTSTSTTTRWRA